MQILQEKITKVIQQTGLSIVHIAKVNDLPKASVYKWSHGAIPSNPEDYNKLINYLDSILNNKSSTLLEAVQFNKEAKQILQKLLTHVGPADLLVEVWGDSMHPTFRHGSLAVVSSLQNQQILNWGGHYYIVDKNGIGNIRRVYAGEFQNSIKLLCDNPDQEKYPPINRYWDHIEAIYKVKAEILKH
jgi:phage repressor protein C with HTH and peptisase S24 domain